MKNFIWLLKWILKAAIFFTLFAFALNNQQDATVNFFFGAEWRAPQVLVVLGAFGAGVVVGVLAVVPRWWRRRQAVLSPANPAYDPISPTSPTSPPHGI